jgi:hypothetical protein
VVVIVGGTGDNRLWTSFMVRVRPKRSYLGYPNDPFACESVLATINMRPSYRPSWWHGVDVACSRIGFTHCPGTLPFPPPPPPILTVTVDLRGEI